MKQDLNASSLKPLFSLLFASLFMAYGNVIIFAAGQYTVYGNGTSIYFTYHIPYVFLVFAAFCYVCAFLSLVIERVVFLSFVVALGVSLIMAQGVFSYPHIQQIPLGGKTDVYVIQYQAARFLLEGKNPYTQDYSPFILEYTPVFFRTYIGSSFVHVLDYPAFGAMWYIPSVILGISGVYQDLVAFVGAMLFLFLKTKGTMRFFIPILLLSDWNHLFLIAGSSPDAAWVILLIFALYFRRRPLLSGVLLALAVSYKQEAWVAFPFVFIYMMKDGIEIKKLLLSFTVTVLGLNAPFFLIDPTSFLNVLLPIFGKLQLGGVGLANLAGWLPRWVFGLLFSVTLSTLLFVFYKQKSLVVESLAIFPMVCFWFNLRSFENYLLYLPFIPLVLFAQQSIKIEEELKI